MRRDEAAMERRSRARRFALRCGLVLIMFGAAPVRMMHVADDPDEHELALKKGADGKTYLGFNAPPGDPADREVVELTPKLMVMKFVDPDTNTRYGTFVYVRC